LILQGQKVIRPGISKWVYAEKQRKAESRERVVK
jgi:hypothetical protein